MSKYEVRDGRVYKAGCLDLPVDEAVADALDVLIAAGWEYRPRTLTDTVQPVVYGPPEPRTESNQRMRGVQR